MEEKNDIPKNSQRSLDEYLSCQDYNGEDGFFKFQKSDKFYFALNLNGKTYLRSQSYTSELARNNGINSVHRNALLDERWIKTKTDDNKFYFCLIAGNRQEIARSCYYNSEAEMKKDYERIRGENSIIGIGAIEIDGVWYSAAKLLTTNKVENIIDEKIEKLELVPNLKSEQKEIPQEIKLEKVEKPKIQSITKEIPPVVIEEKGGCGKLWIWFLLIAIILILCFIFCKSYFEKNNLSDSVKSANLKTTESILERGTNIEKPIGEIQNSEVFLTMQNALRNETSFSIEQLNHDYEMSELSNNLKLKLNEMADFLKNHPEIILEIHGHTDDVGNDQNNKIKSLVKTEMVKKYLVENGISETKIKTIGFGERFPIASNLTEEGKVKNRRIEFKLVR